MKDTRLHNDCDGGQCCACAWDDEQAALRADRRAWFNPNATTILGPEEYGHLQIEDVVKRITSEFRKTQR